MALNSPIISLIFSGEVRNSIRQLRLLLTKPDYGSESMRKLFFQLSIRLKQL